MQIDAHQHFWRLDRGDYGWLTPAFAPLYRDYLPQHLDPELLMEEVDATILIQAAPTESETRFLLEIARATPFVAGVVGWIDMTARNVTDRLAALTEMGDGLLLGVRPMIQDIADPNWVASAALDPAFEAIEQLGLCFDALVRTVHLQPLLRRLERNPDLRVVIDHAAKPNIAAGERSQWRERMAAIASGTPAMCKLSGLVTEAGSNWQLEQLEPYTDHLLAAFGADRVMWGSDWPVVNLTADYCTWRDAAQRLVEGASAGERALIFGEAAAAFYGIGKHARLT
jgi:L-fuconolactonase